MSETYFEVQKTVLAYYWRGRRNRPDWSSESLLAWVADELENSFVNPLEQLFQELTMLGLTQGWHPALGDFHYERCKALVSSMDLAREPVQMDAMEKDELMNDLRILGVVG